MNLAPLSSLLASPESLSTGATFREHRPFLADDARKSPVPSNSLGSSRFGAAMLVSAQSAEVNYQQSQRFELALTTRDGDQLRLQLRSDMSGEIALERVVQAGSEGVVAFQQLQLEQRGDESLAFSVEGELDDEELAAINDLVGQLNKLSDSFFNQGAMAAFEQLKSVGYDSGEIASFSLRLEQHSSLSARYSEAAVSQYRQVAGDEQPPPGRGLGRFVAALREAQRTADELLQSPQQLETLIEQVLRPQLEAEAEEYDGDGGWEAVLERAREMQAELLESLRAVSDEQRPGNGPQPESEDD